MKHITIKAANGSDVTIFIDKITHIYSHGYGRTMIKLLNEEGILVNEDTKFILSLILQANAKY